MDAIPNMLAKPGDMLTLEVQNLKRKILPWDKTLFNVVVQRIILNGTYPMHDEGLEKL